MLLFEAPHENSTLSLLVIVPTLDSYQLLPRLIRSLQAQTFSCWRLLFIDGPSTPEHRRWLRQCCMNEPRCQWQSQDADKPGIFGAMNQGFAQASPDDWLLFWGSDDWAASPRVLEDVIAAFREFDHWPDLLVCHGRYADASTEVLGRTTRFGRPGVLSGPAFSRALWYGSTPPHQATLFGPGAHFRLARYALEFRLSADLDYFLQLSHHSDLSVQCLDLELVHMSDAGVSGQQTRRRLQEVRRAYQRAYGWLWWFPFFGRYVRRMVSLFFF